VAALFSSRFMPCPECGESVERLPDDDTPHRCDPARRVEFQMCALRDELAGCEDELHRYLQTTRGRFEVWLAARQVRGVVGGEA
jgi:hypothetical protein